MINLEKEIESIKFLLIYYLFNLIYSRASTISKLIGSDYLFAPKKIQSIRYLPNHDIILYKEKYSQKHCLYIINSLNLHWNLIANI